MTHEEPLRSAPIFAALTRPQMVAGVPYGFAVANIILCLELFLLTRSVLVFALCALAHATGYAAATREPRFFDLWVARFARCRPTRTRAHWGADVYEP